ncbi:MAG: biotin transporter BioY [Parachlamydiales bacterium]|jgi:biotin transport system substrate-specific component
MLKKHFFFKEKLNTGQAGELELSPLGSLSIPVKNSVWGVPAFLVVLSSSFLLLFIRALSIPLPFTFVPLVFVSQAIFLLAWKLGAKKAFFAVLCFLLQGYFLHLIPIGALCGYQMGYLVSALIIGYASDRNKELGALGLFGLFSLAQLGIYLCGLILLTALFGLKTALASGLWPFLLTDLLKNILTARIASQKTFNR